MDLLDVIQRRFSVRQFEHKEVPIDVLTELVQRAELAPTVNNQHHFRYTVVTNAAMLKKLGAVVGTTVDDIFPDDSLEDKQSTKKMIKKMSTFFQDAPSVIFISMKPYRAVADRLTHRNQEFHEELNHQRNFPDIQSLGAVIQTILLSAVDLGFGGCWLSGLMVAQEELEKQLDIHGKYHLAAAVAIGMPAKMKTPKDLPDISDRITFVE